MCDACSRAFVSGVSFPTLTTTTLATNDIACEFNTLRRRRRAENAITGRGGDMLAQE